MEVHDHFVYYLLIGEKQIEWEDSNGHLSLIVCVAIYVMDILKIHVHNIVVPLNSFVKLLSLLTVHVFLTTIRLRHQFWIKNQTQSMFYWFGTHL